MPTHGNSPLGIEGPRAPVRQVMTDNGHAYRAHDWKTACTQLDIEHIRTRPYTLGTNGKAERLIKTMLGGLGLPLQLPHKRTPHPSPCGLGAVVQQTQTSCLTGGKPPVRHVAQVCGYDS